jgi:hypothetical protein
MTHATNRKRHEREDPRDTWVKCFGLNVAGWCVFVALLVGVPAPWLPEQIGWIAFIATNTLQFWAPEIRFAHKLLMVLLTVPINLFAAIVIGGVMTGNWP